MVRGVDIINHQYLRALDQYAIVSATDAKGIITHVNEKFCEISGYTKEELIGAPSSIVNSQHHDKAFFVDMWKTIAQGNNWYGIIKNKRKSGDYYWVHTGIFPLHDDHGKIHGFFSIRTDITATIERKMILKETRNKLNSFFESTRDVNILLNKDHKIIAFNNAASTYVKDIFSDDLQIDQDMLKYIVHVEEFKSAFDKALNGEFVNNEMQTVYPNGTVLVWDNHYSAARDDEGNIIGVALNSVNVTKRKKYEMELEHRAYLLEQISLTQSHQMRGPVATCMGLISLINRANLDDDTRQLFEMLEKTLHSLDAVIKEVVEQTYQLHEV